MMSRPPPWPTSALLAVGITIVLSVLGGCNKASPPDPTDEAQIHGARGYAARGTDWLNKKEYDKAIADFDQAIRLDPKFAPAYHNRGLAWWHQKEYDRAIADYSEAIRLDPKDAAAYYNRGNAWSDKKEYDKALADYSEVIRFDPRYAPPTTTAPGSGRRVPMRSTAMASGPSSRRPRRASCRSGR
jgi:tetratricopeptide (TPR) repeat protein